MPKKLNPLSIKIAEAKFAAEIIKIGPIIFGIKCLKKTLESKIKINFFPM